MLTQVAKHSNLLVMEFINYKSKFDILMAEGGFP